MQLVVVQPNRHGLFPIEQAAYLSCDSFGSVPKMMNLLRTAYIELFPGYFLRFFWIVSLQVSANGTAKYLALLLIGVIKYRYRCDIK